MAYLLGIDVGGTFIKGMVLKDKVSVYECQIPTEIGGKLADCIQTLVNNLISGSGADKSQIAGVGVCCPGVIDEDGAVVRADNLNLTNYPLKALLEEKLSLPVKVCNDANAAALGEAVFGAGKGYSDSVLITLGTGVGGGIVIGGNLFEGNKKAGAEIGHMVIEHGGKRCSCGRSGCFEAYCSARALTEMTKEMMQSDPSSKMWGKYTCDTADGRTAFEFMDCDASAKKVVDEYLNYLACGIANLANIFRPQAILIGGGVAAQGTRLTQPLQTLVNSEIFAADYAPVEIRCATLGNRAGSFGAAALFMK